MGFWSDLFESSSDRRDRVRAEPFPKEWQESIDSYVPYWRLLNARERAQLRGHIQVLLDEKEFVAAGGLEMTDTIRVVIAAQASVLLLDHDHDYYPKLRSIVVYPAPYQAPVTQVGASGVAETSVQARAGESWARGTVVLAWNSVIGGATNPVDARNVVFHEFAHQLDAELPSSDGSPALPEARMYAAWAREMGSAYEQLQEDLERDHATLLRDYAATNPAEFFAVITEYFFERPNALRARHPSLYELLQRYYGQDPGARTPR